MIIKNKNTNVKKNNNNLHNLLQIEHIKSKCFIKKGFNMSNFIEDDVKKTIKNIDEKLHIGTSYDVLKKEILVADKNAALYYINGMCKEDLMEKLQEFFVGLTPKDMPKDANDFGRELVPYIEINIKTECEEILTDILSGVVCLVVDGYSEAVMIDSREYPSRSISEPEKYRVLRGSRDGFVETLVQNTALIRRRIRSTDFRCEVVKVGESSRTDIAICYMDQRVDKKLLNEIKEQLKNIKTDSLTLSQESLSECLHKGSFVNPFPKFRYTERPDTTAASVLEGQIAIMVDTSPSAMILPTTIFDVIEEADDYYFPPVTGTYLRLSRMIIAIVSLILTPLYLFWANEPEMLPGWLKFTAVTDTIYVPIIFQLLILELAVDGLKLAAVNTPSMLNTPLSLIAAIIIGEFAINTGWFLPQTMLYMAVVAIANFTHENYEFAYSIKYCRIVMLILTQIFGLYGLIGGLVITFLLIAFNKTLTNTSYIYPLYPLDIKELGKRFVRLRKKN